MTMMEGKEKAYNKEVKYLSKIFHERYILRERVKKVIDNINNPYPISVFPKLILTKEQTRRLSMFCVDALGFTLDRFSAELMRRARENIKEEILKELGLDK